MCIRDRVVAALVAPRFLKKDVIEPVALPTVTLEKPEIGNIELYRGLTGTVEPADMVTVTPKLGGEVTELLVKPGDMVSEGQIICQIDTKQVDSSRIAMETAAVNMTDAQANLSRMQVLYQTGDISQQAYEQTVNAAQLAKLQYESAKLAYDTQVEYSSITAPIGGMVESTGVEVHDTVSAQNVICVISGEGSKAVSFAVTEKIIGGLQVGDEIRIEKNGSEYIGKISEVSTMVDQATGLFNVKASLDNAEALATGLSVKLYVISEKADNAVTIPVDAVYYEDGDPKVYIYSYDDNLVHKIDVETGVFDSERMEIKSGLSLEDNVIVTWSNELYEGASVNIAGDSAETCLLYTSGVARFQIEGKEDSFKILDETISTEQYAVEIGRAHV